MDGNINKSSCKAETLSESIQNVDKVSECSTKVDTVSECIQKVRECIQKVDRISSSKVEKNIFNQEKELISG